jgi:hypothetical protein
MTFILFLLFAVIIYNPLLVNASAIESDQDSLIVVGDSRTVNMSKWIDPTVSTTFISKNGQGYNWFVEEGIDQVNSVKNSGDIIIIWLGVNDYFSNEYGEDIWQLYADTINSLASEEWSDCYVYVASVGYVDRNKNIAYYGKGIRSNVTLLNANNMNNGIMEYNRNLSASLSEDITWIDTYDVIGIENSDLINTPNNLWLTRKNGMKDGLHYGKSKTQEIYEFFVDITFFNF